MRPQIRRLLESAGFNPRQLFAALQGAWLEPTPGSIWQENTGVTPTTTGGQTIGRIADLSGYGNVATQATAANRPTYQLNSGLPLARLDSNDSLSVSLPAINVRRNLLTYSEQFDNAAWVKANASITANVALAPDGTATADKVIGNNATTTGNVYQTPTLSANTFYRYSVYAKKGEWGWVALEFRGELYDVRVAWFNLNLGVVGTVQSGLTATIIPIGGGYYRCAVLADTKATASSTRTRVYPTNSDNSYSTGDGTSGIYIWGAQLELGSVATDYQKITDWTSEAFASNGLVYFSTPVGMSALHNQSMGTTYTLPALSSDIYSWMVFPQRLSAVQEARLARYMDRKAGIAGPDYVEQVDDGPELRGLVVTAIIGTATAATYNPATGAATCTRVDLNNQSYLTLTGLNNANPYRVKVNNTGLASISVRLGSYDSSTVDIRFGSSADVAIYPRNGVISFTSGGASASFTIASIKQHFDGMTGQLTADDGTELLLAQ